MTTTQINTNLTRFQNGGYVMIVDGTDLLAVLNIGEDDGAIVIKPGSREAIAYRDRGVQQVPDEGDDMPGELSIKARYNSMSSVKDLQKFLRSSPGTGKKATFKVFVGFADYRAATVGVEWTFGKCVVDQDSLVINAGGKKDFIDVKFINHELTADPARYTSIRTGTGATA